MLTPLAHDPNPYEGVAGRPFDLAWDLRDELTGAPEDLSDITEATVTLRRRVFAGQERPAAVVFTIDDAVTVDAEIGQIACAVDASASAGLGAGVFDLQLDLTRGSEPEPTALRGMLNLLEDL